MFSSALFAHAFLETHSHTAFNLSSDHFSDGQLFITKKTPVSCSLKKIQHMSTSHLLGAFLACFQWEGV